MDLNGRQKLLDATFGAVCETTGCSEERRRTLEEVVNLAVELAREGREGRKIGTLFVIGDVEVVTEQSRPLILDPLFGHDGRASARRAARVPGDGEGAGAARRRVPARRRRHVRLGRDASSTWT